MFDAACESDCVSRGGVQQDHCYSILGCAAGADGAMRFRLRNPWGRVGLAVPGAPPTDPTGGAFWTSGADFAEHFVTVYAATLPAQLPASAS